MSLCTKASWAFSKFGLGRLLIKGRGLQLLRGEPKVYEDTGGQAGGQN